jgi:GAF domain-containing protein
MRLSQSRSPKAIAVMVSGARASGRARQAEAELMYDFRIEAADKASLYRELADAADALTADEPDGIANMANVAALLFEALPDVNWAGFYRNVEGELVLGPFQGRPACIRIPFGKGVCGAAAATLAPQLVADVHAFPGHIACDAASRAELRRRRARRPARSRQPDPGPFR